jgi:hypothetical protein
MWPWKRSPSHLEVFERLESLERRFKTLVADVDEYFQLVRRAENRIKNKTAQMQQQEQDAPADDGTEIRGEPQTSTHPTMLTPRQKLIQQQVLRRRAGL